MIYTAPGSPVNRALDDLGARASDRGFKVLDDKIVQLDASTLRHTMFIRIDGADGIFETDYPFVPLVAPEPVPVAAALEAPMPASRRRGSRVPTVPVVARRPTRQFSFRMGRDRAGGRGLRFDADEEEVVLGALLHLPDGDYDVEVNRGDDGAIHDLVVQPR